MLPVGRVLEITSGGQRALVTTSGATLRGYEVGGRPVLEPFEGAAVPPTGCAGEVLAPWPNRVVDGRWRWRGQDRQLSITEPARGHALHGLVRSLAWEVVEERAGRVALEVLVLAHAGWPHALRCRASYAVGDGGFEAAVEVENVGDDPCPAGLAAHPYLHVPGGRVDRAVVDLAAATWLATDDRLAPTGRRPVAGSAMAFEGTAPVGDRVVDTAFTDLPRRADGTVAASVTTDDGWTTTMWGGPTARWWQLFTGDDLDEPWTRRALALEPMTCGPDAFNHLDDVTVLEPGAALRLSWGLTTSG